MCCKLQIARRNHLERTRTLRARKLAQEHQTSTFDPDPRPSLSFVDLGSSLRSMSARSISARSTIHESSIRQRIPEE